MSIVDTLEASLRDQKVLVLNAGTKSTPVETRWVIGYIPQAEIDRITASAERPGRGGKREVDERALRRGILKKGILEGPADWREGSPWAGSSEDLDILIQAWQFSTMLFEGINEFSTLDEETRVGFR